MTLPVAAPETVLAAFVSAVEVALGAATLVLALRCRRRGDNRPGLTTAEDGEPLLMLLATTLALVGLVAWPLLYFTLASYVPRWPGIMCIQGVTRVGRGSEGLTGWLPGLLWALSILRPAAVFVAGSWMALHLANRRTATAPLARRVLIALAVAGFVAVSAGLTELAYLSIPKAESFLATGCCAADPEALALAGESGPFRPLLGIPVSARQASRLFFGGGAALSGAIAWMLFARGNRAIPSGILVAASLAAAAFLPVAAAFLTETASPVVLHLPHHHCAWCLLSSAPEAIVGVLLVFGAVSCVGWAAMVGWAAAGEETQSSRLGQVRRLLFAALFGFVGSLIFAAIELHLA